MQAGIRLKHNLEYRSWCSTQKGQGLSLRVEHETAHGGQRMQEKPCQGEVDGPKNLDTPYLGVQG